MASKAQTEAQPALSEDELAEMAEAFERTEYSDDELKTIRETRRPTPR